jgi:hypothetical protein
MDRKEIIKRFLKVGAQLDRGALDHLARNEGELEKIIDKLSRAKERPNVITADAIRELIGGRDVHTIKVSRIESRTAKMSMGDLVASMAKRFSLLGGLLENRGLPNLVSINKISPGTKEFSLVCMVASADGAAAEVEDTTGTVQVHLPSTKEVILPDDVLGLICEQKENKIFVKGIVWPGLPINREVMKTSNRIAVIIAGDDSAEAQSRDSVRIAHAGGCFKIGSAAENFKICGSEEGAEIEAPFLVEIENVSILVLTKDIADKYAGYWGKGEDIGKSILRRRDFDPIKGEALGDITVLSAPPDILILPGKDPAAVNYKGTTIISVAKSSSYHIDLSTREVKKL